MTRNGSTSNKGAGVVQTTLIGHTLKEIGTQAAINAMPEWAERARETALRLLRERPITSEDVTDEVGLPREVGTNRNNAIGAVFAGLSNQGLIYRVGSRAARNPQAHARRIPIWKLRGGIA